jgi:hypothetical protein
VLDAGSRQTFLVRAARMESTDVSSMPEFEVSLLARTFLNWATF